MNSENSNPNIVYPVKTSSNELTVKELILKVQDIFRFLISKWLTILLISFVGGLLGFMYSYIKKPVYTASTTFVLEEGGQSGGLGQYAGLASMVGVDLNGSGGGLFQGDNIIELYKSRMMVRNALLSNVTYKGQIMPLAEVYIRLNNLRIVWRKNAKLMNVSFSNQKKFSRMQDSLLGSFVTDINTNYLFVSKPDKKLSIIRVDVKSKDELFAKLFNNEVVKNVNDFYVQTKTKKSLANLVILQHQTDSVRRSLNGAINSAASIADATPNLNLTRQVLRVPAQRSQINAEANKAILTQLVQNLELSKMALRKETPLIQVIDEPILPLNMEKTGKLKGMIFGAFIAGFLCVLLLSTKKILTSIMD